MRVHPLNLVVAVTVMLLLAFAAMNVRAETAKEPARKQAACAPLEQIKDMLETKYAEVPTALMETSLNPLLLFVNKETGTFTMILLKSEKMGCAFIGGKHFQFLQQDDADTQEDDQ